MRLGPIQLLAIDFDSLDGLRGRVVEELDRLAPSSAVRILDVLFVAKEPNGDLLALEFGDLGEEEGDETLGMIVGELLGFSFEGEPEAGTAAVTVGDESAVGIGPADVQRIGDDLRPGTAAALMLIEHTWAAGMREAVLESGGRLRAQGFLTPEGLMLVGAELEAAAEAIEAIEVAATLEAEARVRSLEALATIEIAEEVRAAVVADTILTLVEAGMIEQAAAEEAAAAVVGAALIEKAVAEGS